MDNYGGEQMTSIAMQMLQKGTNLVVSGVKTMGALLAALFRKGMQSRTRKSGNFFKNSDKLSTWTQIPRKDLAAFVRLAKKRGVRYSAVHDRSGRDNLVTITHFQEDDGNIAKILDEIKAGMVDRNTPRENGDRTRDTAPTPQRPSEPSSVEKADNTPHRTDEQVEYIFEALGAKDENPTKADAKASARTSNEQKTPRGANVEGRNSVIKAVRAIDAEQKRAAKSAERRNDRLNDNAERKSGNTQRPRAASPSKSKKPANKKSR